MQLRRVRLELLVEAPWRAQRLRRERMTPSRVWNERAASGATSDRTAIFVAVGDGQHVWGVTEVAFALGSTATAEISGLWVEQARRGQGVGTMLIEAGIRWARERGANRIGVWVADRNAPAIRLFVRSGFMDDGVAVPMKGDPELTQCRLTRSLVPEPADEGTEARLDLLDAES